MYLKLFLIVATDKTWSRKLKNTYKIQQKVMLINQGKENGRNKKHKIQAKSYEESQSL